MNYKDKDNILLIICGGMGIAALALIFRYLFIGLGFDSFGANIVFVIVFVVGLIFFISYLELIQKMASQFTKNKPEVNIEPTEPIEPEQQAEIIEEPKPDLDSIREKHLLEQQEHKEKLLETALEYTRTTFAPYADDENIERLCDYVADYYNAIDLKGVKPVRVKELTTYDLCHFGWNIWNHFRPIRKNRQEDIAVFLKIVFAQSFKETDIETIRKKLTYKEGKFKIGREKNIHG